MPDKYVAKVLKVVDSQTVVINKGSNGDIAVGNEFIIIGLGETIVDPETNEELERLEIVKGKAKAIHVQEKISTLKSSRYGKRPDKKEITKVTTRKGVDPFGTGALFGTSAPETVTESVTPGESFLLNLQDVQVGDLVVRA
jgi:hypothetical protein